MMINMILVMHIALRAPLNKPFYVDGTNVVPVVHSVLDRVSGPPSPLHAVFFIPDGIFNLMRY
jgi:hypothetical protein